MARITLALVFSLMSVSVSSVEAQSIEGVWKMTQVSVINGPDAGVTPVTRTNLLVYTESHFMWAFDRFSPDQTARPERGENPSDADIGRATRGFSSVAGTYIRDGATLTYNRLVSLSPAGQLPENQPQVRTIRQLTPFMLETQSTDPEGVITVLTYARVE